MFPVHLMTVCVSLPERKLREDGAFVSFTVYRCLGQCLAHTRCSVNTGPPPVHRPHRSQVFLPNAARPQGSPAQLKRYRCLPAAPGTPQPRARLWVLGCLTLNLFGVRSFACFKHTECLWFPEDGRPSCFWTSTASFPGPNFCMGQPSLTLWVPAR